VNPAVPEIDAASAGRLVDAGALLLDVRTAPEWAAGHAPQARHVPLDAVVAATPDLPRDADIVVVCRSGRRSQSAVAHLLDNGLRAHNLTGGMLAWTQAGLPVVTDSGAAPAII
jgi:rhodanese-related sulfurtransferase